MNQREKEQLRILDANPGIVTPLLRAIKAFSAGDHEGTETAFKTMTSEELDASIRFLECGLQGRTETTAPSGGMHG